MLWPLGGDEGVLIDGNENERVLELTKGKGAEAVIDFVGEHGSTKMGLRHDLRWWILLHCWLRRGN